MKKISASGTKAVGGLSAEGFARVRSIVDRREGWQEWLKSRSERSRRSKRFVSCGVRVVALGNNGVGSAPQRYPCAETSTVV